MRIAAIRLHMILALLLVPAICLGAKASAPAKPSLSELSESLQQLSARVGPSVVEILSTGIVPDDEAKSAEALLTRRESSGSGAILDTEGFILTNAHVVAGAERIQVRFAMPYTSGAPGRSTLKARGKLVDAELVGIDRETDLAVLKVQEKGLVPLALGDSDALQAGEIVLAFGGPMGLQNSVSMGVVSAVARQLRAEDPMVYIQTDTPINPGNSGGPLVNVNGQMVGINTFILSRSGGSEGLGFAVPSHIAKNVYTQIRKSGYVRRGLIGVNAQTITPALAAGLGLRQNWGVILADVLPKSPAMSAGLQVGDIVTFLDGKPMENGRQLDVNIYSHTIGESVTLQVLRGAELLTVKVPVAERNESADRIAKLVNTASDNNLVPKLGILGVTLTSQMADLLPQIRTQSGVLVTAASPGGARFGGGRLVPGDVIRAVNGARVENLESLQGSMQGIAREKPAVLQVERAGVLWYVTVEGS